MLGKTPFRAIAAFHAVASTGSVARAAQELSVTPSAISQQVRLLEDHLGMALFARSGRANVLTEAGERYFDMIAASLGQVELATNRMRGLSITNGLTVRSAPTFASKWLMPRIAGFLELNPDLQLRLDATNEFTDFEREGVDLDIRYGEGRWPGLHCEPLAQERILPLCSPRLAEAGSLDIDGILRHRIIYSVKALVSWEAWLRTAGRGTPTSWRRILFDRSYMVIQAATDGLGIALESEVFAHAEIASGALVCPLREIPPVTIQANWLVCPPVHLRSAKVTRFRNWLTESLAHYPVAAQPVGP